MSECIARSRIGASIGLVFVAALLLAGCTSASAGGVQSPTPPASSGCPCGLLSADPAQLQAVGPLFAAGAAPSPAPAPQEDVDNDELVPVQLLVLGVAVVAAVLGILGYLLRRSLGLVRLPPPEDESLSHH